MATSAARITWSTVRPFSGNIAMPIDASTWSARPPTTTGSSSTLRTRRTTGTTAWRSLTSRSRIANSSPPRRAEGDRVAGGGGGGGGVAQHAVEPGADPLEQQVAVVVAERVVDVLEAVQ